MTEVNGDTPPVTSEPVPVERGRYAVYEMPDGGILIARTTGLCDGCLEHGCGTPAEPIGPISGAVVGMARAAASGKMNMAQAMKKLMRNG